MHIDKWGETKDDLTVEFREGVDIGPRAPVKAASGSQVEGWTCPHPDPTDPLTLGGGVLKRAGAKAPGSANRATRRKLRRLGRFVRKWCEQNLVPLSPDSDTSVEHWLSLINHPQWRKDELREVYETHVAINPTQPNDALVKTFMKDESYPAFKQARAINARSDAMKVRFGPIFKLIEEVVYSRPEFIKHVPVAERAKYIMDYVYREGAEYVATDYSSFEALFTAHVMENCEFILYDYMTQFLPEHDQFMRDVRNVLAGTNKMLAHVLRAALGATRMSGEMCTSLGNGFSNLMFFLFLSEEVGYTNVRIVVEGDDGLATGTGRPPTTEDFASLGLIIKLEKHLDLSKASFCGLIFDGVDQLVVTDPLEVLAEFGWVAAQYAAAKRTKKLALLRCKALSLAHQYPGCPIIASLANYGLRVTRSIDIRRTVENRTFSWWEREQLYAALKDEKKIRLVDPPLNTRLLVAEQYGIPVECQLTVERYLDSLVSPTVLILPTLDSIVPESWIQYYYQYVRPVGQDARWFETLPYVNNHREELLRHPSVTREPTYH